MDKQQAQHIIKKTFEAPFNKEGFTYFIKNLLNTIDESKAFHARGDVKEMYRHVIKTYERIGTFTTPDNEKVDIIIAYLQKGHSLDYARVTQRNFAGRYLVDRGEKDAGIFAFVSPDDTDWRFSLVKMDYRFDEKGKVKQEFTPARRWSFLVGANERSHTAQSRLLPILLDDENPPHMNRLEEAFNIETVTREFFLEYRNLFIRVKEALDNVVFHDKKIQADFEAKGVSTVDFAKKLLGQIVFLYFLQKKGWFGVGRDSQWGTGSKQFLRELFEKMHGDYKNFFNDILEPLFYEALRNDRSHDDDYYSRFNCKIPFLNGGLFDPIGNYAWVHADINLPDSLFANKKKTREGDEGDGILDIFDRYNFTVKEDEPMEKEVAIDPELLGKAYEKFNAIRPDNFEEYKKALKSGKKGDESKFNKQFGVYYTPREIVHYMCRQSLINYLYTELSDCHSGEGRNPAVSKEDIETLIHMGEHVHENEARVESKGKETGTYSYQLDESVRKNAALIDQKLADITVCDPAVGSGAFPVGMMSEIVKIRTVLTTFIEEKQNRKPYDFKRRCIEHSLYGVDIDPGAVEIAKLRLWLSLVVDEDDIKQIKPLPNLDYKIVCGNSLFGVEKNLFNFSLFNDLEKIKPQFFNETNPTKKQEFKKQIDDLISRITNGHKEFDFEVYFSEVFHEKKGYDVVIANPPYVRQEAIKDDKPQLKKTFGDFFCGTADIYTYFYKCGINVLKPNGHLCFIAPNKFMRAGYGEKTRDLLASQVTPILVIDFGDLPIFDATTYPSIILVENRRPDADDKAIAATFRSEEQLERLEETLSYLGFSMPVASLKTEGWNLEQSDVLALMEKLRAKGVPLGEYVQGRFYRGILTGLNEAYVIDSETRERLIAEDPASAELIKPWL
ncbi:MAG: class I SAM-dependent DNA methyltransferase, partial [Desulfobacteraceae bacterium]